MVGQTRTRELYREPAGAGQRECQKWAALEGAFAGGRYELRTYLATGGMAAVFRGWDYQLRRPVAIKVLRGLDLAGPAEVRRFRREADAAAALHHPNIVEVYDFFEDQGCSYLVMELVEGITLKQHIAAHGPLTPRAALAIAAQVCRGLDAIHAAGFIHRDVKPQNILLGNDGSVKLTDFGIVYVPWAPSFTTGGIVLGTADYVSPEQAQGLPLAQTTDLYSLGVVLYEMVTGTLPFTGATSVAVALCHAAEPVPPPRRINPRLPADVEHVVLRVLRKDPAARYPTARVMGAVLRHVVDTCLASEEPPPIVGAAIVHGDTEWLPPAQVEAPAEEEVVQSAAPESQWRVGMQAVFVSSQLAATWRLAAALATAALLIVGIVLLHLMV